MKLTVLIDNNTFIDHYYCGEPAVSYHIEDEDSRFLFDTGYSDLFIRNAGALGIDLSELSALVFSHGHNDHTRGLSYLLDQQIIKDPTIIAHPDAFKRRIEKGVSIGSPLDRKTIEKKSKLILSREPIRISKHMTFLGEIPSIHPFEQRIPFGTIEDEEGKESVDYVMDDTALVYQNGEGLFIITGCSHSGICNIIEYARQVCKEDRILGVIGGFHLFHLSGQLQETISYFRENKIRKLYPCHCTSFPVRAEIHAQIPVEEVGVGLVICI